MKATAEHLEPYRQWRRSYRSDGRDLAGFWLTPDGDGPHPAVVFNHGSIGFGPASRPGLDVFVELGYAVFAPIRRGHNDEPGPYWLDLVPAPWGSPEMNVQLVAALRGELVDVLAAVEWVAARPEVDAGRIVVAGSSFGGVLTMLALSEPAPLFLAQAFNDHSLQPTYAIGAELARCGRPHETRVYPAIGDDAMTGHGIFSTGVDLWRTDIERFLARWVTG